MEAASTSVDSPERDCEASAETILTNKSVSQNEDPALHQELASHHERDAKKIYLLDDDYLKTNIISKPLDYVSAELSTAVSWPSANNPVQIHDCVSTTWSIRTPIPSVGTQFPTQSLMSWVPQLDFVPVAQPSNYTWVIPMEYQQSVEESEIDYCTPSAILPEVLEESEEEYVISGEDTVLY